MMRPQLYPELSQVHIQRLRGAVEAAQRGAKILFRVNPSEPRTIVWWDSDRPRVQHVIANSFGDGVVMLLAIQDKFEELVNAK